MAKMPRRILAICIDWAIAMLISHAFFTDDSTATLGIFALMQWLATMAFGASVGHLAAGMRLGSLTGKRISPWNALVRVLLICLVIPVAVWDADGRGLHDKAARTVLVRR
jgi:uncharacterized RDD family membrane protein YckC